MENIKQIEKRVCIYILRVANLDKVSRARFTEKVTFRKNENKTEESEEAMPVSKERSQGRWNKLEDPKAGVHLVCLRNTPEGQCAQSRK